MRAACNNLKRVKAEGVPRSLLANVAGCQERMKRGDQWRYYTHVKSLYLEGRREIHLQYIKDGSERLLQNKKYINQTHGYNTHAHC